MNHMLALGSTSSQARRPRQPPPGNAGRQGLNDDARRRLDAEAGSRCAFELLRALGVALTISAGDTAPAMALGRCLGQLCVAARRVFANRVSTRGGEITPSVIERIFSIATQRGQQSSPSSRVLKVALAIPCNLHPRHCIQQKHHRTPDA